MRPSTDIPTEPAGQTEQATVPGFATGGSHSVETSGSGRKKHKQATEADASRFETEILPKLESGELTYEQASLELGFSRSYLRQYISIDNGTLTEKGLISKISNEGKERLNSHIQITRDKVKSSGYPNFRTYSLSIAAPPSEETRSERSRLSIAEQKANLLQILPDYESGKLSGRDVAKRSGIPQQLINLFSIKNGTINKASSIIRSMTASELDWLNGFVGRMHDKYVKSASRMPKWSQNRLRATNSEGTSHSSEAIGHDSIDFEDFYNEVNESEASESFMAASQQPQGMQTYGPSPSFFDGLPNWGATGSSGTPARTSPADSSTGGVVRQRHTDVGQAQQFARVDALPGTGDISVTATQQSDPPALEPLSDRDFGHLLEAVQLPSGTIQSVEDAAMYVDDSGRGEHLVERLRPYVSVAGQGDEAHIQLTDYGRRQNEERAQRQGSRPGETTKRERNQFVNHPTTALTKRFQVDLQQLRIEEGTSHKPSSER